VRLSPARLPRQAGGPAEKDFREWEYTANKKYRHERDGMEGLQQSGSLAILLCSKRMVLFAQRIQYVHH
jgi:hypothetical protein